MNIMNTYVRAHQNFLYRDEPIGLHISAHNPVTREFATVKTLEMELHPADENVCRYDTGPDIKLSREAAQQLLDDLYNAGFRPTVVRHDEGLIEALKEHVDDFRKIIFKKENIS